MIYSLLSRIGIEVWKNIPDFENYQVSNLGNVRNINYRDTGKFRSLSLRVDKQNRQKVDICKGGKPYTYRVYVLMAMSFLNHKPCRHKIVVDHIDNNPSNDKLYNLQLVTHRFNNTKDRKGTSKYTGVYWDKQRKKWRSQISINGKSKYLGSYKNEKQASMAYQKELKLLNE
jgi:hypothetical protein